MGYYRCQYCGEALISGYKLRTHIEGKYCKALRR